MWRRVSCEQPLNTSQSILNPTRSRYHCRGVLIIIIKVYISPSDIKVKGNLVSIPEPGDGTVLFDIIHLDCIIGVT
jgi:hypothetical protein